MEVLTKSLEKTLKKDKQLLILTHLSQLLDFVTGFGGIIAPLIIWLTQKDRVEDMDVHGKQILNFKISMLVYLLLSIPLLILFGLGLLIMVAVGIISLIFPIINAIKVSNNEKPQYPFTIEFIK